MHGRFDLINPFLKVYKFGIQYLVVFLDFNYGEEKSSLTCGIKGPLEYRKISKHHYGRVYQTL
ncbi:hypothetical protein DX873_04620 [Flagellimonas nanhaiensis]|uniref:Uncharacterized protein n=1 Tax=Flagellimonas nanhaiensis TaxID=2292706 RepID=A0A371JUG7_9FLAO|nr:hypothetical protein DX873_04620 [Allomuricauda nanhaiensis]